MVDPAFITQSLVDLVRINSINPGLEEGGPGEIEIGDYIHRILLSLGFEATIDALARLRSPLAIAKQRSIKVEKLFNG